MTRPKHCQLQESNHLCPQHGLWESCYHTSLSTDSQELHQSSYNLTALAKSKLVFLAPTLIRHKGSPFTSYKTVHFTKAATCPSIMFLTFEIISDIQKMTKQYREFSTLQPAFSNGNILYNHNITAKTRKITRINYY